MTDKLSTQTCPNCQKSVVVLASLCHECCYPIEGTEKERVNFQEKQKKYKNSIAEAKSLTQFSIYLLYFLGVLHLITFYRLQINLEAKAIGMLVGSVYFALGVIASQYKPMIILTLSLLFYTIMELWGKNILTLPITLFDSFLGKTIIVFLLAAGIAAAYRANKLKQTTQ